MTYELMARYDARQSFYGKARVFILKNGTKALMSYNTIVALIDKKGNATIRGLYSQTTTRHQKEFLRQNGFGELRTKDLEKLIPNNDKEFRKVERNL